VPASDERKAQSEHASKRRPTSEKVSTSRASTVPTPCEPRTAPLAAVSLTSDGPRLSSLGLRTKPSLSQTERAASAAPPIVSAQSARSDTPETNNSRTSAARSERSGASAPLTHSAQRLSEYVATSTSMAAASTSSERERAAAAPTSCADVIVVKRQSVSASVRWLGVVCTPSASHRPLGRARDAVVEPRVRRIGPESWSCRTPTV
jgi:hypothetical protein